MADFFRIQLGIVSRAEGHCAAKRSAYQSCGVVVAHDGERFDFTRKASEHVRTIVLTPPDAPEWVRTPESLWQCAAAAEKRVDAQEARIVDFSMPRAVPADLWEDCIRRVYEPFLRMGMALQVDVHDTLASDGGRNVNVHGLATLREIEDVGFATRKNRAWNDRFRERNGRVIREEFAERLTAFCGEHGINYQGDARPNSERDLPDPEPNLARWNFEVSERTGQMTEALAALQEHRMRRREWEEAQAEAMEAALDLSRLETRVREQRRRRITPADVARGRSERRDRRAAILRAWHGNGWVDAEAMAAIRSTRFDAERSCLWIDLRDGTTLIDHGDSISLRGRLTWQAAMETATAAERHGWESVEVSGDQVYKDAVAMACMLRGIEVTNHVLSSKAQAAFDRLHADRPDGSINPKKSNLGEIEANNAGPVPALPGPASARSSHDIHLALKKRIAVPSPAPIASPDAEVSAPAFKPIFARKAPKKLPSDQRHVDFDKAN